jgi:hypothetical protein
MVGGSRVSQTEHRASTLDDSADVARDRERNPVQQSLGTAPDLEDPGSARRAP